MGRKWWRWPEGYTYSPNRGAYLPWFVIARRLMSVPFILVGGVIAFIGVAAGFGLDEARRYARDVF